MGKQRQPSSLKSKAAHLVSDLTTGLLNPISDKPSSKKPINLPPSSEDNSEPNRSQLKSISEESPGDPVEEPDTSSFSAFLYSLLSPSDSGSNSNLSRSNDNASASDDVAVKESSRKKSLLSRGKQSLGRAIHQATRFGGYRNQASSKGDSYSSSDEEKSSKVFRNDGILMQTISESIPLDSLPEASEKSLLLSEKTRSALYVAFPSVAQGRKWVLLYSTWRHGISLSTLYRRSMLCPGPGLLVVGDRKGAIFGGLVEAPLKPTNRRYQGTNNSFVFTNTSGRLVIFRPTGMNRYFTLCSPDYLALGGGSHFALYLDSDLLNGSSSASETYGNPCLAHTEDFDVKEIELWGFVYASKYDEMVALLRTEAPGICRW